MTTQEQRTIAYAMAYGASPQRIHQLINQRDITMPNINHTDLLDIIDHDDILNYLDEQDVADHFGLYTVQEKDSAVLVAISGTEDAAAALIEALESRVQELQEQVNQYEQGGLN